MVFALVRALHGEKLAPNCAWGGKLERDQLFLELK